MVRYLKPLFLLLLVVFLISACASLDRRDRISKLEKSLRDYGAALRWGLYSDASDFLLARDGTKPELQQGAFDNYRVTRMEVRRSDLNEDETEAQTYVVISYYKDTSGTIREIKQVQDWWYSDEAKRWFLDGDLPYPEEADSR